MEPRAEARAEPPAERRTRSRLSESPLRCLPAGPGRPFFMQRPCICQFQAQKFLVPEAILSDFVVGNEVAALLRRRQVTEFDASNSFRTGGLWCRSRSGQVRRMPRCGSRFRVGASSLLLRALTGASPVDFSGLASSVSVHPCTRGGRPGFSGFSRLPGDLKENKRYAQDPFLIQAWGNIVVNDHTKARLLLTDEVAQRSQLARIYR